MIFLTQGLKYCNDINYLFCVVLPFTYIIIINLCIFIENCYHCLLCLQELELEDVYVKDDNEYKLLTVVSNDSISKEGRYVIDKEGKINKIIIFFISK